MPVPWTAIGAIASGLSFAYTVITADNYSNDDIIRKLSELETKIDEIVMEFDGLIRAVHGLESMTRRVVNEALVNQQYSFLDTHFDAFMELESKRKRRRYVKKNFESMRGSWVYCVDFEKRIDGLVRLSHASEQFYVMMLFSKDGIALMKKKIMEKMDSLTSYKEDLEDSLSVRTDKLANRYLKHRYIARHNYVPQMKRKDFSISWRTSWVRDCLKPGESDFKSDGGYSDPEDKSTWSCNPPYRQIEGAAFRTRFRRIRNTVQTKLSDSVTETRCYEFHKAILEGVFAPYLEKLASHDEKYEKHGLYDKAYEDSEDEDEGEGEGGSEV